MNDSESLVGRWAVCSIGRLGKIEGRKTLDWGESWVGTGINGKPWASRAPLVLSEGDARLIEELKEKAWMYEDLSR